MSKQKLKESSIWFVWCGCLRVIGLASGWTSLKRLPPFPPLPWVSGVHWRSEARHHITTVTVIFLRRHTQATQGVFSVCLRNRQQGVLPAVATTSKQERTPECLKATLSPTHKQQTYCWWQVNTTKPVITLFEKWFCVFGETTQTGLNSNFWPQWRLQPMGELLTSGNSTLS